MTDATDAGGQSLDPERRAAHWLAQAEAEAPRLLSGGRPAALGRFERDYDQYRRALAWYSDADRAAAAAGRTLPIAEALAEATGPGSSEGAVPG